MVNIIWNQSTMPFINFNNQDILCLESIINLIQTELFQYSKITDIIAVRWQKCSSFYRLRKCVAAAEYDVIINYRLMPLSHFGDWLWFHCESILSAVSVQSQCSLSAVSVQSQCSLSAVSVQSQCSLRAASAQSPWRLHLQRICCALRLYGDSTETLRRLGWGCNTNYSPWSPSHSRQSVIVASECVVETLTIHFAITFMMECLNL